jgi:hypothetical protein
MILRRRIDPRRWQTFVELCFPDDFYQVESLVAELFESWEPAIQGLLQPNGSFSTCHI